MPRPSSSDESSPPALCDVGLALLALLVDQALDLLVLARVQRGEGEVLQLPLDGVDAEPVRDRRVDVQGLLGLVDLLLLRHRADRAHVVQPVGELDEDDPDVRGHRDHHLAVVLGLRLVARGERDPGELRDAVDERRDLLPVALADLVDRGGRVLDGVVQQRRAQRLGVQAHARADLRHADRVDDELLTRLAALVGVVLAGEAEGVLDPGPVDLDGRVLGVLLDDREEVAEQAALGGREVGATGGRRGLGVLDAVHGRPLLGRPRGAVGRDLRGRLAGGAAPLRPGSLGLGGHLILQGTPRGGRRRRVSVRPRAQTPASAGRTSGAVRRRGPGRLGPRRGRREAAAGVRQPRGGGAEGRGALEVGALGRRHRHRAGGRVDHDEAELGQHGEQASAHVARDRARRGRRGAVARGRPAARGRAP